MNIVVSITRNGGGGGNHLYLNIFLLLHRKQLPKFIT